MVDLDYLEKGLNAMSRAHHVNTMAGHLGAAVVAGYFIAEQHPNLDDKVYAGIESELNRIIRGESVFSPRKDASITVAEMFTPFAKEQPDSIGLQYMTNTKKKCDESSQVGMLLVNMGTGIKFTYIGDSR